MKLTVPSPQAAKRKAKVPRRASLRNRMVAGIVIVVAVIMVSNAAVVVSWVISNASETAAMTVSALKDELKQKGLTLSQNVALSSERAIAYRNYLFVKDIMRNAVRNDSSILYGALAQSDGTIVMHTNQDPSAASPGLSAENLHVPTIREVQFQGKSVLESVAPLKVADKPWGTVSFGLSLARLDEELVRSRERAVSDAARLIGFYGGIALTLIVLGAVLANALSSRLTSPLTSLLNASRRLRQGNYNEAVHVTGLAEYEDLAAQFNEMTGAIRQRQAAMQAALESAEEASRLKSEFLANMSHELRTPLNAVTNVPDLLLKDFVKSARYVCGSCNAQFEADEDDDTEPNDGANGAAEEEEAIECPECGGCISEQHVVDFRGKPDFHREYLQMGFDSARHLLHLVSSILDYSKLEAGKMELIPARFNVQMALDEARNSIEVLGRERGLTVSWPETDFEWDGDCVKIAQIIVNLVGNAIKFTERGGRIDVKAHVSDPGTPSKMLVISVRDTGVGIPEEQLGLIFDSFRQADGSHTRKYGGTGLGLAITKQLTDLHGGRIKVESEVGVGSCFTVSLASLLVIKSDMPQQKPLAGSRRCVVVVDDDKTQIALVQSVLKEQEIEVVPVNRPAEAIGAIRESLPGLVLLDVIMPGMNGMHLLQLIRADQALHEMPVIVSSAYPEQERRARELGASWIKKPWNAQELIEQVSSFVVSE